MELPIGPNKLVLGNSSGVMARVLERWQLGFIYSVAQGKSSIHAREQHALCQRPSEYRWAWDRSGNVSGARRPGYFGSPSPYLSFIDPQCTNGTVGNTSATDPEASIWQPDQLHAAWIGKGCSGQNAGSITSASGTATVLPLLENPLPGNQGNLGAFTMKTLPRWALDGNLSKNFRISQRESHSVSIRCDEYFESPVVGRSDGTRQRGK